MVKRKEEKNQNYNHLNGGPNFDDPDNFVDDITDEGKLCKHIWKV